MNWDDFFFKMCGLISEKSKDPSSKFGCVIVGPKNEVRSIGYNGLPRGVNDNVPERNERPGKYFYYEHSERNAFYNAGRVGIPLEGCRLYVGGIPCADCARGIIQTGIVEVVVLNGSIPDRWKENLEASMAMLKEAGVTLRIIGMEGGGYGKD